MHTLHNWHLIPPTTPHHITPKASTDPFWGFWWGNLFWKVLKFSSLWIISLEDAFLLNYKFKTWSFDDHRNEERFGSDAKFCFLIFRKEIKMWEKNMRQLKIDPARIFRLSCPRCARAETLQLVSGFCVWVCIMCNRGGERERERVRESEREWERER